MIITATRRQYGSASVYVENGPTVTSPSTSTGSEHTGQVESYWVDDDHQPWQWWMQVHAVIRPTKKNGHAAARTITVDVPRTSLPPEITEALAALRPDITDWLKG